MLSLYTRETLIWVQGRSLSLSLLLFPLLILFSQALMIVRDSKMKIYLQIMFYELETRMDANNLE